MHSNRQWPGGRGSEGEGLDRCGQLQNRVHRAKITLENGYCESFNASFRDELLNGELFHSIKVAKTIIEN